MTNYDIEHELASAIRQALEALMNVPEVGSIFDQQHADTQLAAYLQLSDAFDKSALF